MTEKALTLASLNVRGLRGGKSKPKEIKAWLASLPTPPQIVLIQEHHLRKEDAQGSAKGIEFWHGSAFWNEGIPMGRSQRTSTGTTILVDKAIASLITAHGTLIEGRTQFITLQSPDNGILTIINVCAPQSSNERALLWQRINQADLSSDHIILGGDCNHHEATNRRSTVGEKQMRRRESASWHHMTLRYGLTDVWRLDSFRKLTKKAFTYDNGTTGVTSVVSRIDKFLVSQTLEERGGRIEVAASVRKLTDHSPFVITIWGQHNPPSSTPRFFDISLLSEERSRQEMLDAWVGSHSLPPSNEVDWPAWLEAATGRFMMCNVRLSKEKKRAQGTSVRVCTKKIQLAEIQLQRDPVNEEVRSILSNSQGKLVEIFQTSVERNRHLSSSNWFRYGDTCSKSFFDFHRIGKKKTLLRELNTETEPLMGQTTSPNTLPSSTFASIPRMCTLPAQWRLGQNAAPVCR
jgi:exonuclease III